MIKYRIYNSKGYVETLEKPFYGVYDEIEFDPEESIREEEARKLEKEWSIVRQNRNQLLFECDWTVLPDSKLSEEKIEEFKAYRQALRDITLQSDPFNIVYPEKPY